MLLCSRFSAFFPFSLAFRGAVAQLGERLNGIQEVVGSIPIGSTMKFNHLPSHSAVTILVGASSGATCWLNPQSLLTASSV
jgi:hypothetical protein